MKQLTRIFVILLVVCLFSVSAMATGRAQEELHVLSWTGYVDVDTLADFEAETGIKVVWSPMESPEDMLLKITQTGGEGYDLILSSDYSLEVLIKEKLVATLDTAKLANYANLDPAFLSQPYDPANAYVIPYTAGCMVIIYDPTYIPFEITGYNDLWREELIDSIALIDNGRVMGGITFKSMGLSMNEIDDERLTVMGEKLAKLAPNVRTYNDESTYSALVTGDASVSFTYAVFASMAYAENPALKVVYPEEGLGFGVDGFVLSAKSKNTDNAYAFLDYLMRPEVAAHNAEMQGYMCVNQAAKPFLSEAYLSNPSINVPSEALANAEIIMDVGSVAVRYQELFDALKLQ